MSDTQVVSTQAPAPVGDGQTNGGDVVSLKDVLGPVFGTVFTSDEDALKSVESAKNMSGEVGQLKAQLAGLSAQSQNSGLESKVQTLEKAIQDATFFAEHPEYNTPEAKELIREMGGTPSEIVAKPVFKSAFEAIQARNEMEKSKSVLMTNPRLGQVTDKISQARELAAQNTVSSFAEAKAQATAAVLEAYDMK